VGAGCARRGLAGGGEPSLVERSGGRLGAYLVTSAAASSRRGGGPRRRRRCRRAKAVGGTAAARAPASGRSIRQPRSRFARTGSPAGASALAAPPDLELGEAPRPSRRRLGEAATCAEVVWGRGRVDDDEAADSAAHQERIRTRRPICTAACISCAHEADRSRAGARPRDRALVAGAVAVAALAAAILLGPLVFWIAWTCSPEWVAVQA
jgi:hypothetical protein